LPREQGNGGLPRGRDEVLPRGPARSPIPGRSQKIDLSFKIQLFLKLLSKRANKNTIAIIIIKYNRYRQLNSQYMIEYQIPDNIESKFVGNPNPIQASENGIRSRVCTDLILKVQ